MQGSTALLTLHFAYDPSQSNHTSSGFGPEVMPTHVQSASFFGDFWLAPAPKQEVEALCHLPEQKVFASQPVVFLVRDHAQMSHFLTVQLAPLYAVRPNPSPSGEQQSHKRDCHLAA